ncbi:MAG TPA: outer membrane protein assembly factor BamA [Alphaproteobacteria bacterium]|nr:outer membrane protein assembly factor BamA [Alphaproteobacteria bacterium]
MESFAQRARRGGVERTDIVRAIRVEGTNRIEVETVVSYMLIKPGDPYDIARVNSSIKTLFATGLFSDVSFRREGDTLVVRVVENPIVNRVAFEGNKKLDDDDLLKEITLRPRTVYTRTKVQRDVKRLLEVYRGSGRFAATITPKIIQLSQNRVDLVFEINEGDITGVRRIVFVGNKRFSDGRLRDVIQTEETAWWKFFTTQDTYDPDRLNFDRELLRRFYLGSGYADFRVVSAVAELTPDRKDFFVTFTIEEGERYKFGEIELRSAIKGLDVKTLRRNLTVKKGAWYDARKIESTIQNLTNAVGTLGFAFVEVRPLIRRDRANRAITVVFLIREGPKVFVERIEIVGNNRTRDEVIRREMRLVEGDAFNTSKIRASRRRLRNLDYFKKVEISNKPGSSSDKTVIKVEVEEKATGELSLGAGFSTEEGALGTVGLRERNFLGRGQDISVAFTLSQRSTEADLKFTEPYFLDRNLAVGFDLFRVTRDRTDESGFNLNTTGFRLRASYEIIEDLRQGWRYTIRNDVIRDLDSGVSSIILSEEGSSVTSAIGQTLTYDKRDDRFDPTEGYFLRLETDFAGLGGTQRYVRAKITAGYYQNLGNDLVLSFVGEYGIVHGIGKDVGLADRFFLGGNNLRGFERGGVGPRDGATDDSLGANQFYAGTVELTFPLGLPKEFGLRGRVWTDAGSAFGIDRTNSTVVDVRTIRVSAGVGVSWKSPFGPVRLDIGLPLKKEGFDKTRLINFNFGARF